MRSIERAIVGKPIATSLLLMMLITPAMSIGSLLRTDSLLQLTTWQWWYICRSRRSASSRFAAMMQMLSTRWPLRVRMLKPQRVGTSLRVRRPQRVL